MLLKVAFDSEGWLVQIGNVVQLLYLFLIIVQVRSRCRWLVFWWWCRGALPGRQPGLPAAALSAPA